MDYNDQLHAHETIQVHTNAIASGCSFADVTVDMPLGQVKINKIINVQDNGRLINPSSWSSRSTAACHSPLASASTRSC